MTDPTAIRRLEAPLKPPFAVPSWLRPLPVAGGKFSIAGGWARFDEIDLVQRDEVGGYSVARLTPGGLLDIAGDRAAAQAALDRITAPRADFASLAMNSPRIMGILNVTPDSFSDGGRHNAPGRAVAAGRAMVAAGADILDIGGESTRPGADPVTRNQELARVLPPIAGLKAGDAALSIDTRHAEVMTRACDAGATIINDVNGLRGEGALAAAAAAAVPVIIMHMKGTPETMQDDPVYGFAPVEIFEFLEERLSAAEAAGIPRHRLAVDPGFGFGKTVAHNMELMGWSALFHGLGVPILIGASRKSSIARISAGEDADHRLAGSLVLAMQGVAQGCQLLRVHDVADTRQALAVQMALAQAG